MATPTYIPIAITTLTSATSSVSFNGITQDFRDLVLVAEYVVDTNSLGFAMRFNGDSSSTYETVYAWGTGSSALSGTRSQTYIRNSLLPDDTDRAFAIANIMDYSATDKHKTALVRFNSADKPDVEMIAGRWPSTSAITSITLTDLGSGDFASGSTFSIYGIAGVV